MMVQALSMTGSDLCTASKCWDAQEQTSDIIYAEFYEQVTVDSLHMRDHSSRTTVIITAHSPLSFVAC